MHEFRRRILQLGTILGDRAQGSGAQSHAPCSLRGVGGVGVLGAPISIRWFVGVSIWSLTCLDEM